MNETSSRLLSSASASAISSRSVRDVDPTSTEKPRRASSIECLPVPQARSSTRAPGSGRIIVSARSTSASRCGPPTAGRRSSSAEKAERYQSGGISVRCLLHRSGILTRCAPPRPSPMRLPQRLRARAAGLTRTRPWPSSGLLRRPAVPAGPSEPALPGWRSGPPSEHANGVAPPAQPHRTRNRGSYRGC